MSVCKLKKKMKKSHGHFCVVAPIKLYSPLSPYLQSNTHKQTHTRFVIRNNEGNRGLDLICLWMSAYGLNCNRFSDQTLIGIQTTKCDANKINIIDTVKQESNHPLQHRRIPLPRTVHTHTPLSAYLVIESLQHPVMDSPRCSNTTKNSFHTHTGSLRITLNHDQPKSD